MRTRNGRQTTHDPEEDLRSRVGGDRYRLPEVSLRLYSSGSRFSLYFTDMNPELRRDSGIRRSGGTWTVDLDGQSPVPGFLHTPQSPDFSQNNVVLRIDFRPLTPEVRAMLPVINYSPVHTRLGPVTVDSEYSR